MTPTASVSGSDSHTPSIGRSLARSLLAPPRPAAVLDDLSFSQDVTFQKDSAGESTVVGQFVNESGVARGIGRIHGGRVYAYQAESHERAQQRGRQHIAHLVDQLKVKPREESIESAHRVYKMALQKGFTRGRRTSHVAAACLYLLCRQDDKPFFLIDFSDILQVSVFSLGAVFLQLAKLLRLENQPQFTKPVDPSLYIHRFADKMGFANDKLHSVSSTAMRLVASMKRDWIQTGRRPSGVCGAALYIATHLHGDPRTKREIVNVVHIGEFTLSKRLNEFSTTPAGEMNKQEFLEHSEMLERQEKLAIEHAKSETLAHDQIGGCYHVQQDRTIHFRQGMCKECYLTFVGISGVYDGANPPSFSKNREKETREMLALEEKQKEEEEKNKAGDKCLAIEDGVGGQRSSDDENGGENGKDMSGGEAGPSARRRSSRLNPGRAEKEEKAEKGEEKQKGRAKGRKKGNCGKRGEAEKDEDTDAMTNQVNMTKNKKASKNKKGSADSDSDRLDDDDLGLPAPLEGGSYKMDKNSIDSAVLEAAENMRASFTEEIDKLEEQDARKRKKRRMSTAHIIAQVSRQSVDKAAMAVGESREMIEANRAGVGDVLPLAVVGDFDVTEEQTQEELEELLNDENLSDISDSDINQYIAEEEEVKCKETIWNMMNQDWMEKQEAKKAAQAAQLRAQEEQRLAMEKAQKAGTVYKRGRGRPLGSKSKPKNTDTLPTAETPEEAAMRVMDDRKLSTKINYTVLQQLFEKDGSGPTAPLYNEGGEGDDAFIPKLVTVGSGMDRTVDCGGLASTLTFASSSGVIVPTVPSSSIPTPSGIASTSNSKSAPSGSKKSKKSKREHWDHSRGKLPVKPPSQPPPKFSEGIKPLENQHGSLAAGRSDKGARFDRPPIPQAPGRLGSLLSGNASNGPAGLASLMPIQRPQNGAGADVAGPPRLGSLSKPLKGLGALARPAPRGDNL